MSKSIGPTLRKHWRNLSAIPGGRWFFSRALGVFVPYTGTLGARVRTLQPGYCEVTLHDRRRVRNHLQSVHAMALCNLGEMVTGLALMHSLPDKMRGILSGISVEYLKKARGSLVAECRCDIPADIGKQEVELSGGIRDSDGDIVARVTARWLIGPEKEAAHAD